MQQLDALRRANEVRSWQAEQKRTIEAGDLEVWCGLCRSGDVRLRSVALVDFLQWLPGIGRTKAREIIREVFLWPSPGTELRRVATLDLPTAAKLCREARLRSRQIPLERFATV